MVEVNGDDINRCLGGETNIWLKVKAKVKTNLDDLVRLSVCLPLHL